MKKFYANNRACVRGTIVDRSTRALILAQMLVIGITDWSSIEKHDSDDQRADARSRTRIAR